MAIIPGVTNTMYDSSTLLGVYEDLDQSRPAPTYFRDTGFPDQINSTDEYIDFAKVSTDRKIAPLVVPTAQGKPIYSSATRVSRFKPAYVKPKDPISPDRVIKKIAGLSRGSGLLADSTPASRWDALIADIIRTHRDAIDERKELMAAEALLTGKVILEDEAYPRTEVDFGRDPSHTITLAGAARWGQAGVSIMDLLQTWVAQVRRARFGGAATRLTVGGDVWELMRKDQEIKDALDNNYRLGNNVNLNLGISMGERIEYKGNIEGLQLFVNSETYTDGSTEEFYMDQESILLTSPSVRGVQAYGAIMDAKAGLQALEVFIKMWENEDPSAIFIMSQCAPLMVPVNPNASLSAKVL